MHNFFYPAAGTIVTKMYLQSPRRKRALDRSESLLGLGFVFEPFSEV